MVSIACLHWLGRRFDDCFIWTASRKVIRTMQYDDRIYLQRWRAGKRMLKSGACDDTVEIVRGIWHEK